MDQALYDDQPTSLIEIEGLQLFNDKQIEQCELRCPTWRTMCMNFNFMIQKQKALYEQKSLAIKLFIPYRRQLNGMLDSLKSSIRDLEIFIENFEAELKKIIFETPITQQIFKCVQEMYKQDEICDDQFQWLKQHLESYSNPSQTELDDQTNEFYHQLRDKIKLVQQRQSTLQENFKEKILQRLEYLDIKSLYENIDQHQKRNKEYCDQQKQIIEELQLQQKIKNEYVLVSFDEDLQSHEMSKGKQILSREKKEQQEINKSRLLSQRESLKQLMEAHSQDGTHCCVKGGGSFGYCWTGGYGWRGLHFEYQGLQSRCAECIKMNVEMHDTVKELYELGYRETQGWWVSVWFLYPFPQQ